MVGDQLLWSSSWCSYNCSHQWVSDCSAYQNLMIPFFWFLFAWNTFFHSLTFSLFVSLGLKCVPCRQYMYGSCFCIHSANLCLLFGALNPLTFMVIIDMYFPIAIFLIDLGLCRYFSSIPHLFSSLVVWWPSLELSLGCFFFCVCIFCSFLVCISLDAYMWHLKNMVQMNLFTKQK